MSSEAEFLKYLMIIFMIQLTDNNNTLGRFVFTSVDNVLFRSKSRDLEAVLYLSPDSLFSVFNSEKESIDYFTTRPC